VLTHAPKDMFLSPPWYSVVVNFEIFTIGPQKKGRGGGATNCRKDFFGGEKNKEP